MKNTRKCKCGRIFRFRGEEHHCKCGRVHSPDGTVAYSPEISKPRKLGLGDRLEQWLKRVGITQERYVDVKKKFGLPPMCNCKARRKWFNKVGRYLGL